MTSPSAPARARRLGLYGPFVALAIAAVAWSFGWFWLKGQAEQRLDATAVRRAAAGGQLAWSSRRVSGFPFRIDIDFTGLTWREPTGWGLQAPVLRAEASVFAPGHWVAVAPAGATLVRPTGGDVAITARVLRASLSNAPEHPPSVSVEGLDLAFTPVAGAAPYALVGASELHIHTRAGPSDQGAAYLELDDARATPAGALGALTAGQPMTVIADGIWSHAGALSGASWERAVNAWSAAGGRLEVRRLKFQAGAVGLSATGPALTADPDGRLAGALDATLTGAAPALTALAGAHVIPQEAAAKAAQVLAGRGARTPLTFQAGRVTLGGVPLADAPKVY